MSRSYEVAGSDSTSLPMCPHLDRRCRDAAGGMRCMAVKSREIMTSHGRDGAGADSNVDARAHAHRVSTYPSTHARSRELNYKVQLMVAITNVC
jgi:hypothetical protein